MSADTALIVDAARSAVIPLGGAFKNKQTHELGRPIVQALLARQRLPAEAVDAVVLGNALGAGGNPARLLALASGLRLDCASYTVDTQCCAGLDALTLAVGLLRSGQASVVLAGGVESWSRAPIRMHRPRRQGEAAQAYERPAFVPPPMPDPDMLLSAARYAAQAGYARTEQEAYALSSHERAYQTRAGLTGEIVDVGGVREDAYPRVLSEARAARFPSLLLTDDGSIKNSSDYALSALTVSPKADGAGLLLLATPEACVRYGLQPLCVWRDSVSVGADPTTPMLAAAQACFRLLSKQGLDTTSVDQWELHDAFAVQGLDFCRRLALDTERVNPQGGGLARGHPIGASAAIAAVRLVTRLANLAQPGEQGIAAVAGAGGLGAAALLSRC